MKINPNVMIKSAFLPLKKIEVLPIVSTRFLGLRKIEYSLV